jgi:hypothetical protein
MCPHTTICVLVLLYMKEEEEHVTRGIKIICVLVLLYMCPLLLRIYNNITNNITPLYIRSSPLPSSRSHATAEALYTPLAPSYVSILHYTSAEALYTPLAPAYVSTRQFTSAEALYTPLAHSRDLLLPLSLPLPLLLLLLLLRRRLSCLSATGALYVCIYIIYCSAGYILYWMYILAASALQYNVIYIHTYIHTYTYIFSICVRTLYCAAPAAADDAASGASASL